MTRRVNNSALRTALWASSLGCAVFTSGLILAFLCSPNVESLTRLLTPGTKKISGQRVNGRAFSVAAEFKASEVNKAVPRKGLSSGKASIGLTSKKVEAERVPTAEEGDKLPVALEQTLEPLERGGRLQARLTGLSKASSVLSLQHGQRGNKKSSKLVARSKTIQPGKTKTDERCLKKNRQKRVELSHTSNQLPLKHTLNEQTARPAGEGALPVVLEPPMKATVEQTFPFLVPGWNGGPASQKRTPTLEELPWFFGPNSSSRARRSFYNNPVTLSFPLQISARLPEHGASQPKSRLSVPDSSSTKQPGVPKPHSPKQKQEEKKPEKRKQAKKKEPEVEKQEKKKAQHVEQPVSSKQTSKATALHSRDTSTDTSTKDNSHEKSNGEKKEKTLETAQPQSPTAARQTSGDKTASASSQPSTSVRKENHGESDGRSQKLETKKPEAKKLEAKKLEAKINKSISTETRPNKSKAKTKAKEEPLSVSKQPAEQVGRVKRLQKVEQSELSDKLRSPSPSSLSEAQRSRAHVPAVRFHKYPAVLEQLTPEEDDQDSVCFCLKPLKIPSPKVSVVNFVRDRFRELGNRTAAFFGLVPCKQQPRVQTHWSTPKPLSKRL